MRLEADFNNGSTRGPCVFVCCAEPDDLQGVLSLLWKEDSTTDESQNDENAIDWGGRQDLSPCTDRLRYGKAHSPFGRCILTFVGSALDSVSSCVTRIKSLKSLSLLDTFVSSRVRFESTYSIK